jgi:hypothetical protein
MTAVSIAKKFVLVIKTILLNELPGSSASRFILKKVKEETVVYQKKIIKQNIFSKKEIR